MFRSRTRGQAAVSTPESAGAPSQDVLAGLLIRDLVDRYPGTLAVLSPLGIDLCCGGGHPLGEALRLHGFDTAAVLPAVEAAVANDLATGAAGR